MKKHKKQEEKINLIKYQKEDLTIEGNTVVGIFKQKFWICYTR